MAISFVGSAEGSAVNGANVTLTLPAMQQDDLVIVAYAIGDNDNIDFIMAMVTAGYTKVADLFANDTQDTSLGVFWKKMGATPDTTAEVDGQGGADAAVAAVAMVFRGVDTTTPMDVAPTIATAINTMHPNPPSIDPVTAGFWTVIAGASGYTLIVGTYTFPTGYTVDAIDRESNDTSEVTVGMGYRTNPADPEDPGVMTHSGTDDVAYSWCAVTLALRPASVGALLEGSIGMTATLVGVLTTAITMAGSILAQAAAAAILTTQITIGGAVAGQMAPAAALTTEIHLAGQVAGQLTPSGDLTTAQQALLEGQIAGTLQGAGDLTTEIRLAGTAAGTATLAGDLETAITLEGLATGQLAASGDISGEALLQGAVGLTLAPSGELTTAIPLSGTLAWAASLGGDLATAIVLAGLLEGRLAGAGELTAGIPYAGFGHSDSAGRHATSGTAQRTDVEGSTGRTSTEA